MADAKKSDDSKSASAKKAADTRKAKAVAEDAPAAKSERALVNRDEVDTTRDVQKARKTATDYGEQLPTDKALGDHGQKPPPNDPVDAETKDSTAKEAKAVNESVAPRRGRRGERKAAKLTVVLRDDNDNTWHDVKRLVVLLGGEVTGEGKGKKAEMHVEAPLGADRAPDAARDRFVQSLSADPLVEEVKAR